MYFFHLSYNIRKYANMMKKNAKFDVYRKPTHTNQYIPFHSHAPLSHKYATIRSLTSIDWRKGRNAGKKSTCHQRLPAMGLWPSQTPGKYNYNSTNTNNTNTKNTNNNTNNLNWFPNSGFLLLLCSLPISLIPLLGFPPSLSLFPHHSRLMKVRDLTENFAFYFIIFVYFLML